MGKGLDRNILVISDLHLGEDLRPGVANVSYLRHLVKLERALEGFLQHHAQHRKDGRPWTLVVNGDMVDFMSIVIMPEEDGADDAEDRLYGLGFGERQSQKKLEKVIVRHQGVFGKLAEFIAAGNELVIVVGNHDVEFHYPSVQRTLTEWLIGLAVGAGADEEQKRAFASRIQFCPWFYYRENVVYIEHGHQYDAYCSFEHLLCPLSPSDPRRTTRSISDVLLRYVVRPTPGMMEAGHGTTGRLDYLKFAARLGSRGIVQLAQRFLRANRALVRLWREHSSAAVERIRLEHERVLEQLSREHRLPLATLRHLDALRRPPITRRLLGVFASVMVDRVLLGVVGTAALVALTLLSSSRRMAWSSSGGALAVLVGADAAWGRLRSSAEPSPELRERAAHVAKLLGVRYVVMGHTHLPEVTSPVPRATYVNLGAWAEDDTEDGKPPLPATRTHLVITRNAARGEAELLQWTREGPLPFPLDAEPQLEPAPVSEALLERQTV